MRLTLAVISCLAVLAACVPQERLTDLYDRYYEIFSLQSPGGRYQGSKTVIGQTINVEVNVNSGSNTVDFTVKGAISISCSGEPYTFSGGELDLTNKDKSGDCLHDALKANSAELLSVSYDAASDSMVASLKYLVLTITVNLRHASNLTPELPEVETTSLADALKYYPVSQLQDPSGNYAGSKTILGQTVNIKVAVGSSTFNFDLDGIGSIHCKNEPYTFSGGKIVVTNIDKAGDCLHDGLKDNSVTLKSINYDSSSDSITISCKYGIIGVNVELDHTGFNDESSRFVAPVVPQDASLETLLHDYYPTFILRDPHGTYKGSKSVLGVELYTTVTVLDSSYFNIALTGGLQVSCDHEAYSYANGVITVTNLGKDGDCIHDAMQTYSVTLKSMAYDPTSDSVSLKIAYASFLTIEVVLEQASMFTPVRVPRENQLVAIPPASLQQAVHDLLPVFALQNPAGSYNGTKSVLGVSVKAGLVIKSGSELAISITGPVTIVCNNEPYSYSNGVITLTAQGDSKDCVHKALAQYGASIKEISYDSKSDSVEIQVKYSVITISLDLQHTR